VPSSLAPSASTASRSNVRDDRETPLCVGRDDGNMNWFGISENQNILAKGAGQRGEKQPR
jgi:hypothetical protein